MTITPQEVADALGKEHGFLVGSKEFEVFAPLVGHLIEVVHEIGESLDSLVRLESLCRASYTFLRWLAENPQLLGFTDQFTAYDTVMSYFTRAASHEKLARVISEIASLEAYDEYQILASSETSLQLSSESQLLFVSGQLTFRALLLTNPSALLP